MAESLECESRHLQLKSIYSLSKKEGDIKIKVIPPSINKKENTMYEPLRKRRKLNDDNKDNHNEIQDVDNNDDEDDDLETKITSMRASSIILKSGSPVFKNMLSHDMMEKAKNEIEIIAECDKDVDDLIYFLCVNKPRKDSNLMNLLKLAHYYQMGRLFKVCRDSLIKNIKRETFVEIVNLFEQYSIKEGYEKLVAFALKNEDKLRKEKNFNDLPHCFKYGILRVNFEKIVLKISHPTESLRVKVKRNVSFRKLKEICFRERQTEIDSMYINGEIIDDAETVQDVVDRFDCDINKCIDVVGIWAHEYDEDTDSDNDYV